MENLVSVYQVVGGWQASDPTLHMAAFGHTEAEARRNLAATQELACELDVLIKSERRDEQR